MSESALEAEMALQIRAMKLPAPKRELVFAQGRRWRFDFAWPSPVGGGVALEVEGGTWSGGRHTTGSGFEADCEKYSEAALLGWSVIRATGGQVKSGRAIAWLKRALEQ